MIDLLRPSSVPSATIAPTETAAPTAMRWARLWLRFSVTITTACIAATGGVAAADSLTEAYTPVTEAMLLNPPDGEWLMWRRTYDHWGYSPLDQIKTSNVGNLRLAWAWTLASGLEETTPLVHDGIMFLPQACDFVEAVDARDGTPIWQYERRVVEEHPAIARLACAKRNGVLYEDKLLIATHDAFLVALDARSGAVVWEKKVGDWAFGHHYSGGPQIIRGQVVAGMSGCYYYNAGCWISAHDPATGDEIWRTQTIPGPADPPRATLTSTD